MKKPLVVLLTIGLTLALSLGITKYQQAKAYGGGYYNQHNCWFSPYMYCSGNSDECPLEYVCKQKIPKPQ